MGACCSAQKPEHVSLPVKDKHRRNVAPIPDAPAKLQQQDPNDKPDDKTQPVIQLQNPPQKQNVHPPKGAINCNVGVEVSGGQHAALNGTKAGVDAILPEVPLLVQESSCYAAPPGDERGEKVALEMKTSTEVPLELEIDAALLAMKMKEAEALRNHDITARYAHGDEDAEFTESVQLPELRVDEEDVMCWQQLINVTDGKCAENIGVTTKLQSAVEFDEFLAPLCIEEPTVETTPPVAGVDSAGIEEISTSVKGFTTHKTPSMPTDHATVRKCAEVGKSEMANVCEEVINVECQAAAPQERIANFEVNKVTVPSSIMAETGIDIKDEDASGKITMEDSVVVDAFSAVPDEQVSITAETGITRNNVDASNKVELLDTSAVSIVTVLSDLEAKTPFCSIIAEPIIVRNDKDADDKITLAVNADISQDKVDMANVEVATENVLVTDTVEVCSPMPALMLPGNPDVIPHVEVDVVIPRVQNSDVMPHNEVDVVIPRFQNEDSSKLEKEMETDVGLSAQLAGDVMQKNYINAEFSDPMASIDTGGIEVKEVNVDVFTTDNTSSMPASAVDLCAGFQDEIANQLRDQDSDQLNLIGSSMSSVPVEETVISTKIITEYNHAVNEAVDKIAAEEMFMTPEETTVSTKVFAAGGVELAATMTLDGLLTNEILSGNDVVQLNDDVRVDGTTAAVEAVCEMNDTTGEIVEQTPIFASPVDATNTTHITTEVDYHAIGGSFAEPTVDGAMVIEEIRTSTKVFVGDESEKPEIISTENTRGFGILSELHAAQIIESAIDSTAGDVQGKHEVQEQTSGATELSNAGEPETHANVEVNFQQNDPTDLQSPLLEVGDAQLTTDVSNTHILAPVQPDEIIQAVEVTEAQTDVRVPEECHTVDVADVTELSRVDELQVTSSGVVEVSAKQEQLSSSEDMAILSTVLAETATSNLEHLDMNIAVPTNISVSYQVPADQLPTCEGDTTVVSAEGMKSDTQEFPAPPFEVQGSLIATAEELLRKFTTEVCNEGDVTAASAENAKLDKLEFPSPIVEIHEFLQATPDSAVASMPTETEMVSISTDVTNPVEHEFPATQADAAVLTAAILPNLSATEMDGEADTALASPESNKSADGEFPAPPAEFESPSVATTPESYTRAIVGEDHATSDSNNLAMSEFPAPHVVDEASLETAVGSDTCPARAGGNAEISSTDSAKSTADDVLVSRAENEVPPECLSAPAFAAENDIAHESLQATADGVIDHNVDLTAIGDSKPADQTIDQGSAMTPENSDTSSTSSPAAAAAADTFEETQVQPEVVA